jgi:glycosyltransferase involved in cell wall biosynthesis
MAMETPVVATASGGTAEIARHGREGLIVPPGDSNALVAAMRRTMQEPEATAARVHAARRRVEHELSFDSRMRAVEQVYIELAQHRFRPGSSSAVVVRT